MRGVVDWFNDAKGFGFAITEDGKKVFIHYTQILDSGFKSLNAGDVVEFDLYENIKGFEAKGVKKT